MNIIFTGMRGSGKTTLGEQIAQTIGWDWIDLDQLLEIELNQKLDKYVEEYGWDAFRDAEKKIALESANRAQTVISTGGGTMMHPESAQALKDSGVVVLLKCDLDTLRKYLENSYERPSLTGTQSALDELMEIWEERKDQYHEVADIVHDTSNWPPHDELLDKLREHPDLEL
jgi:shikimate kinase